VEISFTAGCCSLSPGFGRGETGGGNWRKLDTHLLREGPGEPGKEPGKVDTHLPPTSGRSWRSWKRAGETGHPPTSGRSWRTWKAWAPTYLGADVRAWREPDPAQLVLAGRFPGSFDNGFLPVSTSLPAGCPRFPGYKDFRAPASLPSGCPRSSCLVGVQDFPPSGSYLSAWWASRISRLFEHPPLCLVGVQDFSSGGCPRFLHCLVGVQDLPA